MKHESRTGMASALIYGSHTFANGGAKDVRRLGFRDGRAGGGSRRIGGIVAGACGRWGA